MRGLYVCSQICGRCIGHCSPCAGPPQLRRLARVRGARAGYCSTAARRHGGVFCSRLVPDISPAQPRCSSFPSTLFRNPAQNSIRAIHFWSDYILHEYLEKLDGIFQHNLHPHDLNNELPVRLSRLKTSSGQEGRGAKSMAHIVDMYCVDIL